MLEAGVDGRTVIVAGCGIEDAPGVFRLAKERGLRLDLTIGGMWSSYDGSSRPLEQWTAKDWAAARANDERIGQLAASGG